MARLAPQKKPLAPIPGVDGLFAADLTLGQLEELQKFEGGDPSAILLWMSEHLIRDEQGQQFEDLLTREDILALPYSFVSDLITAIRDFLEAMSPGNQPSREP